MFKKLLLVLSVSGAVAGVSHAEPLKIGFITTLSTPAGYLGEDARDAFLLALKQKDGKLGGVEIELIVEDDGLKPANGKQAVDRMLQNGVELFTGVTFSNVLAAVVPSVVKENKTYISLNPGPSVFAGKRCSPNYFVASYQNDYYHSAGGAAANEVGYDKVVLLAPNYQAGRDAINGFKSSYKGEVVAEIYTNLDQSDFSVEIARIRSLNPDAIYQFHPGGLGINFAKQYGNSGLNSTIPMIMPGFSMDARMIEATGQVAEDFYIVSHWALSSELPQSQQFVKDFQAEYGRVPTEYAMVAYDTALWYDSAISKVGGDISDKEALHAAIKEHDFESLRGSFSLANNQHPILDYYLLQLRKDDDGELRPQIVRKVIEQGTDNFAVECEM